MNAALKEILEEIKRSKKYAMLYTQRANYSLNSDYEIQKITLESVTLKYSNTISFVPFSTIQTVEFDI